MFRVGQKVVCVDAKGAALLKKGSIYMVLAFDDAFLQIDCEPSASGCRSYFRERFRPIVERKTDISIFKAMLTPAGQKERV